MHGLGYIEKYTKLLLKCGCHFFRTLSQECPAQYYKLCIISLFNKFLISGVSFRGAPIVVCGASSSFLQWHYDSMFFSFVTGGRCMRS